VFIVNGSCTKADGNFLGDFYFKRIGETGITIGSYPASDMDVQAMYDVGVSAVLDIQTTTDHRQRGIGMERMLRYYKSRGINLVVNYPVSDIKEKEYIEQLFQASQHLHDMIEVKGHHVYLHCAAGVSRSATLLLVYLALFLKHKHWDNLPELHKFIQQHYYLSFANILIAQKCIDLHRDFQSQQKINYEDEEERRRKAMEEAERQRQLKIAQEEAEKLRLQRLAEQEQEKLRLQRLQYQEAERMRQQKMEEEQAEIERKRKMAEDEARLHAKRLADEHQQHELKRRLAEEEAKRDAEKRRVKQEAELEAERLRLQKLAIEAAREEARMKKEHDEREEADRQRQMKLQKEESERQRKEREELEAQERLR